MGGFPRQPDFESLGSGLRESPAINQSPFRIPSQIMKGIDFCDPFFLNQIPAPQGARSDFFARLKDEIDIPGGFHTGQLERKPAQGCTVSVMPALVRDTGIFRSVGQVDRLRDRQSIHIRTKGNWRI